MEKHAFRFDTTKISRDEFIELIVSKEPINKRIICEYITRKEYCKGHSTQPVYDKLNSEECRVFYEPDNKWYRRTEKLYSDGVYCWYETDLYNLEKYNIMPSDEFVQYVLDKTR